MVMASVYLGNYNSVDENETIANISARLEGNDFRVIIGKLKLRD